MSVPRPAFPELPQILAAINRADHVLVALDYDGTLAPIVDDPKDAAVPPETRLVLARVAAEERCTLAIVSGRSLADLRSRTGVDAVLAGNHGLEIEGRGIAFVHERAQLVSPIVADLCCDLERRFQWIPGVAIESKQLTATIHFRQAPHELHGWIRTTVEAIIRPARHLLQIAPALQALEIRPKIGWNKGSVVRLLLGTMRAGSPALICAGDDRTDEDMFGILPDEISVKIGAPARTKARYYVRTPLELCGFLRLLSGVAGQPRIPEVGCVIPRRTAHSESHSAAVPERRRTTAAARTEPRA